jgi:hypothetical protein
VCGGRIEKGREREINSERDIQKKRDRKIVINREELG